MSQPDKIDLGCFLKMFEYLAFFGKGQAAWKQGSLIFLTHVKFPVRQCEFATTIVPAILFYQDIAIISIFQANYPCMMYFLNEIWLMKSKLDNLLFSYNISCQDVDISCTQCVCMCGD